MAQNKPTGANVDADLENLLSRLRKDPKDVRTRIKLAELYYKRSERKEAIQQYILTARTYTDLGFHPKAIAVYKQVLYLDPDNTEVYQALADLYSHLGLSGEVMSHYKALASLYEQKGEMEQALATIARMADLDPGNYEARLKLAGKFYDSEMPEKGRDEFRKAVALVEGRKTFNDVRSTYEMFFAEGHLDAPLITDFGNLLLDHDMADAFVRYVGSLTEDITSDPLVMEVHAKATHAVGETDKAIGELKQAIQAYEAKGMEVDHARATGIAASWGAPLSTTPASAESDEDDEFTIEVDDLELGEPEDVSEKVFEEDVQLSAKDESINEIDVFGSGKEDGGKEIVLDEVDTPSIKESDVFQEVSKPHDKSDFEEIDVFNGGTSDSELGDREEVEELTEEVDLDNIGMEEEEAYDKASFREIQDERVEEEYKLADDELVLSRSEEETADGAMEFDLEPSAKEEEAPLAIPVEEESKAEEDSLPETSDEYDEITIVDVEDSEEAAVVSEEQLVEDAGEEPPEAVPDEDVVLDEETEKQIDSAYQEAIAEDEADQEETVAEVEIDKAYQEAASELEVDVDVDVDVDAKVDTDVEEIAIAVEPEPEVEEVVPPVSEKAAEPHTPVLPESSLPANLEEPVSVYLKHGLPTKALAFLETHLEKDAENLAIQERIWTIHVSGGDAAKARNQLDLLAEMAERQQELEKLGFYLSEIIAEEPDNEQLNLRLKDIYLKTNPAKAVERLHALADMCLENMDNARAKDYFNEILGIDSENETAHRKLAKLYQVEGETENAIEALLKVSLIEAGKGELDKRKNTLLEILKLDKEQYKPRVDLLETLKELGDRQGAGEQLFVLASLDSQAGRDVDAETHLKAALDLGVDRKQAHGKLKDLYISRSDMESATEQLDALASVDLETRNYQSAEAHLLEALDLSPDSVHVHERLKKLYQDTLQNEKAIIHLFELVRLSRESGDDMQMDGYLQQIIDIDPHNEQAHSELIHLYEKRGDTQRARYQLFNLANIHIERVRDGEAEKVLLKILDQENDNERARSMLKAIYLRAKDTDKAIEQLYLLAGLALGEENRDLAKQRLEEVLELDPEAVRARTSLKDLYLELGQTENAKDELFGIATIQAGKGDVDGACEAYKQILELDPDSEEAFRKLKDLLAESGRSQDVVEVIRGFAEGRQVKGEIGKAASLYEELLQFEPTDLPARIRLKDLYIRLSAYPQALQLLFELHQSYAADEQYDEAEEALKEVLRIDRSNEQANRGLKDLYIKLGRNDDAVARAEVFLKRSCNAADWQEVVKIAEEILGLKDDHREAKEALADALIELGRTDEAMGHLLALAERFESASEVEDAEKTLRRILFLDDDNLEAHQKLIALYKANDLNDRAVAELFNLADKSVRRGLDDDAKSLLADILTLDPDNLTARERLIALNTQLGNKEGAVEKMFELAELLESQNLADRRSKVIQDLLILDPRNERALRMLADVHLADGHSDRAAEKLLVLLDLAEARKDYTEMEALLKEIRKEIPQNEQALRRQIAVYKRLEQPDKVQEHLFELADMMQELDKRAEAENALRDVLRMDSGHEDAHQRLKNLFLEAGDKTGAADENLKYARRFIDLGEWDKAGELLKEALEMDPANQLARLQLKEMFQATDDNEGMLSELFELAKIASESGQSELYEKYLHECLVIDPVNTRAYEALKEHYVTTDNPEKALAEIFRYAESLMERDDIKGAEAAYQDAISILPATEEAHRRLLSIYQKTGKDELAISELFTLADLADQKQRPREVEDCLRTILSMDRTNQKAHERLKEFYLQNRRTDRAVAELFLFGQALQSVGLPEREEALLTEVLELDPGNEKARRRLKEFYRESQKTEEMLGQLFSLCENAVEKGDLEAALMHMREVLSIEPDNQQAHLRIKDLYLDLDNPDGAVSQLFKLADLAMDAGETESERGFLENVLSLRPQNTKALEALKVVHRKENETDKLVDILLRLANLAMETNDYPSAESNLRELVSIYPEHMAAHEMLVDIYKATSRKDLAARELMQLADKAIEVEDNKSGMKLLTDVLSLDSRNIPAYQRLKNLHLDMNNNDGAVQALQRLVELSLYAKDDEQAEIYLQEILNIDPERKEAHEQLKALFLEQGESAKAVVELFFLADQAMDRQDYDNAISHLQGILELDDANEECRRRLKEVYLQKGDNKLAVEQLFKLVDLSLAANRQQTAERFLREVFTVEPENKLAKERLADLFMSEPSQLDDLENLFYEADKAISQARKDDAEEILSRILSIDPENLRAREKLNALKISMQMKHETDSPGLDSMFEVVDVNYEEPEEYEINWEDDTSDKGSSLADHDLSKEVPDLFEGAGQAQGAGASDYMTEEQQEDAGIDTEDAETHFNMGIAYMEVDLFQEAAREFQIAAKDKARKYDAVFMIGKCLFGSGKYEEAIQNYELAMQETGVGEDEELDCRYEIARSHIEMGETTTAKTILEAIKDIRPDFKEVNTLLSGI